MDLPVMPPVAPMLAKSVKDVPTGPGYLYEPKWDGFRCIVFRDGDEVELGSRNERPMTRYFPEVVAAVKAQLPERCVVDGEIIIATGDKLDFEALLQRIHPAASRVTLLAEQTPASLVIFDLLALGDESYLEVPLGERRRKLDQVLAGVTAPVHRTSVTDDPKVAQEWFGTFEGAGLDGVVAKPIEGTYEPDKRAMLKIKHERTADCVVAGFRWHKKSTPQEPLLGSLLLGLFNDEGSLQHVGVVASFPMARRAELIEELAPWRENAVDGHPWQDWAEAQAHEDGRLPGAQSRWNAKKDLSWEPLRAERVVEVRYDHMEGTRFRHTTQFVRWRDDREPRSCTYEQLEIPVSYDLAGLLS
ncbi:MAG TPA: ATP-dependent DNA ligase [Mycobacteriales bacterium]